MDDIGEAFDGGGAQTDAGAEADGLPQQDIPRSGETPPDELARVREKAAAKIGQGGETGMSGAESGRGVSGGSAGLESTERSDLSDEGLEPTRDTDDDSD